MLEIYAWSVEKFEGKNGVFSRFLIESQVSLIRNFQENLMGIRKGFIWSAITPPRIFH